MKEKISFASPLVSTPRGFSVAFVLFALVGTWGSARGATTNLPFTVNTNWTCQAGVTSVQVQCWGGGGSGASTYVTVVYPGGGGAGGSFAGNPNVPVSPGTVYAIRIPVLNLS